ATDTFVPNKIIEMYGRCGSVREARAIFDAMPCKDAFSWVLMMRAYARHGDLDGAQAVFVSMPCKNLMVALPTKICFVPVLIAYSHQAKVDAGLSCFVSMSGDFGLEPVKQHYCCVVHLLASAGYLRDAEDVVEAMPFVPDAV
ncbi:hypothetical protein SELMODRAFT_71673, partial [Selaginella moellendorffii]